MAPRTTRPGRHADVVVLGAGLIGTATAQRLAARGVTVTLVDPGSGQPQFGVGPASLAAGAMLGALGEVTVHETARASVVEGDPVGIRLAAADRYPAWLDELEEASGGRPVLGRGTFVVAGGRSRTDPANLDAIEAAARRHHRPVRRLAAGDIPGWRPASDYPGTAGLHLPEEGYVDAPALMTVVADAADRSGRVQRLAASVRAVVVDRGRAVGVTLDTGDQIRASVVILAAGFGIQSIVDESPDLAGLLPRIVPGKGVGLLLAPPLTTTVRPDPAVIRTPNRDFACGLHLVPRGDHLYLGATNRIGSHARYFGGPTVNEIRYLLERTVAELDTTIDSWQPATAVAGHRPVTVDGAPIAGLTDLPGLAVAGGTYRNGVLLAPLLADWVAEDVLAAMPADHPYSPRGRGKATVNPLDVVRAGLPDLATWLVHDADETAQADLLGALFAGVLAPTGAGADVQAIVERSLAGVPLPEILPELVLLLRELGTSDRP
jgi:glycine oxidase